MKLEVRGINLTGWIGIILSVAYLGFIYKINPDFATKFKQLGLNEQGDFMAGVFGPLAILWLVLGFFQQGNELRINSEALMLQANELKNSAAQQSRMVELTKKQAENQIEAQETEMKRRANEEERRRNMAMPIFELKCLQQSGFQPRKLHAELTNFGPACTQVHVGMIGEGFCRTEQYPEIKKLKPNRLLWKSIVHHYQNL